MAAAEEIDIVIVGGGISGLATALGLHRKGIRSVVLERSETLRTDGAALSIFGNGWRALEQLGLASALRSTAIPYLRNVDVFMDKGSVRETPLREVEARCLRRRILIKALANDLPLGTIRFGCQVVSASMGKSSSRPVLQLSDGSLIKAKVLIGCDGENSLISNFIGLKPPDTFSDRAVRGVTEYPDGHGFKPELLRITKGRHLVGRIPIDERSVYWFVSVPGIDRGADISKEPSSIRQFTSDAFADFPTEIVDMIKNSDLDSLTLTRLRYRAPWRLLLENFRREAATVAGDAWHLFGPFLGQGGSAALEDAVVLARCLSRRIHEAGSKGDKQTYLSEQKAKEAVDEYLRERRKRVVHLSTLSYVRGLLVASDPSALLGFICILMLAVLFRDPLADTRYDCGEL